MVYTSNGIKISTFFEKKLGDEAEVVQCPFKSKYESHLDTTNIQNQRPHKKTESNISFASSHMYCVGVFSFGGDVLRSKVKDSALDNNAKLH